MHKMGVAAAYYHTDKRGFPGGVFYVIGRDMSLDVMNTDKWLTCGMEDALLNIPAV